MLYARAHYFNAFCYFMEHFVLKLHFFSVRLPDSGSHLGDASVPAPTQGMGLMLKYVRRLYDVLCVVHPYVREEAGYTFG